MKQNLCITLCYRLDFKLLSFYRAFYHCNSVVFLLLLLLLLCVCVCVVVVVVVLFLFVFCLFVACVCVCLCVCLGGGGGGVVLQLHDFVLNNIEHPRQLNCTYFFFLFPFAVLN